MTLKQALISSLHLLFVFVCFGAGFFCVSLAYLPDLKTGLADVILFHEELCTQVGIWLFGVAFLLLLGLYGLNRRKFLRFVMGKNSVEVREKVIRSTIDDFFKTFSPSLSLVDLEIIGTSRLEMQVAFRNHPKTDQIEPILGDLEKDLTKLLSDRFGYKQPFVLALDIKKSGLGS